MKIIDGLPIRETGWLVRSPDGAEEVKPFQIVVLVSIANQGVIALPEDAPRFPAILDPGNNHNFAIRQGHLDQWAPMNLPRTGQVEVGGFTIPLLGANVWIHPNRPGLIDPSGQSPFCLELKGGIAVYPTVVPNPARLPILGLRGLIRNRIRATIDGASRALTLEAPSA